MHQMDLTEGVIWKKLILYAGPVVLSSLLQSAYSITDLIVAGWFIGKDGISAINNASQVMMILTQIIMGITTGGNILMGQYFGSKDRSNRVKTNRTMFGFALSAGALLSVLLFLLSRPILAASGRRRWRRPPPISRCDRRSHCHLRIQCLGGHAPLCGQLQAALLLCGRDSGL